MFRLKHYLVPCRNVLFSFQSSIQPKVQLKFFSKTNSIADNDQNNVPNNANLKDGSSIKSEESKNVKKWLEEYKQASDSKIKEEIMSYMQDGHIQRAIQLHKYKCEKSNDFQLNFPDHLQLITEALNKGWLLEAKYLLGNVNKDEIIVWGNDTTRAVINIFTSLKLQKAPLSEIQAYEDLLVFSQKSVPSKVLRSIIHNRLKDLDDIDGAFDLFKRIAEEFKQTVHQHTLLCRLIENKRVNEMKQIFDISVSIHKRENSIKTLAMAFIDCGHIDQAKKLFESQKMNDNDEMMQNCIHVHLSLGHVQQLKGMLIALENCILPKIRQEIYASLLRIYEKKGDLGELKSLILQMDAEQSIPHKRLRDQVAHLFRKNELDIPESWSKFDDEYGSQLECLLKADQIEEANRLLCKLLEEKQPQPNEILHYLLLKNSEKGNISIFEHFRDRLDDQTKQILQLNAYECDAYRNAGKAKEYVEILRRKCTAKTASNKYLMKDFTDNIIDMISQHSDIYDEYKKLATEIADEGLLKPIYLLWAHNFIHGVNDMDNQLIWKQYFSSKSTFICSKIPGILYKRKDTKRLQEFLNLRTLNKLHVNPKVLGESYGLLFSALIKYNQDYDTVILELKKVMNHISKNDFNAATKNLFKRAPPEICDKIFEILNSKN